jgi:NAD(P)-dependent dehydrogenase (short-subunit alcohol dehydrogenase family)
MPTYLITGANRGLGLEFARQLSQRKDETKIIATARKVEEATDLARLVHDVIALDVADPKSIEKLPDLLKDRPIDILINNAGVGSKGGPIEQLEEDELQRVFTVNAFGPMLVSKALLKNLRAGQRKTIFNITSQLGSITNNHGGSSYSYRGSKAALNMMTVSLANELKKEGFTCVVTHPGWVQTDMGGPNATLKPEESIAAMLKLIDGLKPEDNGKFFNYDGKPMPW